MAGIEKKIFFKEVFCITNIQNKNILTNIGYHISSKDLKGNNQLEKRINKYGIGWVQFFLGNPRSYQIGKPTIERVKNSSLDLNYIVHSPYIVNIVDEGKGFYKRSIECLIEALNICDELGVSFYVTHLGSLNKEADSKQVVEKLKKSCQKILTGVRKNCQTKLLLETSPGSKSGTKIGKLEELLAVSRSFSDYEIGVCLDTEHAFANGLDLNQLDFSKIEAQVDVIHLNSIPEDVALNSHRDKHGKTELINSRGDVKESLKEISRFFDAADTPLILERNGKKTINSDLEYLEEILEK